ncbi:heme-degrading domain-containing protein [Microvirga yunnanensis]|uniref:heme-degrading domain-containing protein n=1 Tax=Microvirga yunnanensis TaxID=2953740 RepID=UPI0021C88034|nr:heme-degrading domain-containing protein [Microvirga sp. HBU65207]
MNDNPSLDALLAEEQELQFPSFNADVAWVLGNHIRERARIASSPIAIEISRSGQQLFFAALLGATPDNAEWIRRKRALVQRFHHSSLYMSVEAEQKGRPFLQRYGLSEQDYAAAGGGFPIFVKDTGCVGAVVVSGLPQLEDHRLVTEAVRATITGLTMSQIGETVEQEGI